MPLKLTNHEVNGSNSVIFSNYHKVENPQKVYKMRQMGSSTGFYRNNFQLVKGATLLMVLCMVTRVVDHSKLKLSLIRVLALKK